MRVLGDVSGLVLGRQRWLHLTRRWLAIGALVSACVLAGSALAEPIASPADAPPQSTPDAKAAKAKKKSSAPIKVHDQVVLTVEHPLLGKAPAERAQNASQAISAAIASSAEPELRVERAGELAVVWAGKSVLLTLGPDDAGSSELDAYAASTASKLRQVIKDERERSAIADTVFSISFVVFWALIALYGLRKAGEVAHRSYTYLVEHPERVPGIELQSFEVVGPKALRSGLLALIAIGRYAAQISIVYVWLVVSLSRFDATRPLTERLTSFALKPLSELAIRFAATLPIALVVLAFGAAVYVLVRFTRLFFASVSSGATKIDGLPRDLAGPTGALVSMGIVLAALVIAGPLVTGDAEGALARTGGVALLALGLASTPLLATALLGARLVFGRRFNKGDHVELAGFSARVREVTLLEVRLVDDDGAELRIPHLLSLVTPMRVHGRKPRAIVELWLAAGTVPAEAIETLTIAASRVGEQLRVQLLDAYAGGALYRIALTPLADRSESDVRIALLAALTEKGIALGLAEAGRAARSARVS